MEQGVHQLAGAFHRVTGQIDHRLAPELRDPLAKPSRGFFGRTMADGRPLSDGPSMLRIDDLPRLLDQLLAIRAGLGES